MSATTRDTLTRVGRRVQQTATRTAHSAKVLGGTGIIRPYGPLTLGRLGLTVARWGTGFAGGFLSLATRYPDRVGLIDELGELSFGALDERSTRLAHGLESIGIGDQDSVAVLCRNSRYFIDASTALAKVGADILYLNTAFAAPQLAQVCARERPSAIIFDQEFAGLIDSAAIDVPRIVAWGGDHGEETSVEELIARSPGTRLRPPRTPSRPVILTSGTTGTPKGALRGEAGLGAAVALLERMPLKHGWRTHIAAPMFHTWGWAHLNLAMMLGSTLVLARRFDPEDCVRLVAEHRCESLVVIPVMMQRMCRLPAEVRARYDVRHLRATTASGSALAGGLATEWMDAFGDNLYNIYGSTEVAWVSVASPAELRRDPSTAGRPPRETVVRLFDDVGNEVGTGESGRIFVGNSMLFAGYTGGGSKESIGGLMSTGDVGRFDAEGLLYVEGRDDEMIVSGGENVFPKEVEDTLARHPAVLEAAAIGVDDAEFGQRLRAFVVASGQVGEEELREWVREHLARYKAPRDFVFLAELPRNATGKIVKRELRSQQ